MSKMSELHADKHLADQFSDERIDALYLGYWGHTIDLGSGSVRREREAMRNGLAAAGIMHSFGYLYHSPDTGIEWAPNHPVESGEVPDAEDVRPATIYELHSELMQAWELLQEARAELRGPSNTTTSSEEGILDD